MALTSAPFSYSILRVVTACWSLGWSYVRMQKLRADSTRSSLALGSAAGDSVRSGSGSRRHTGSRRSESRSSDSRLMAMISGVIPAGIESEVRGMHADTGLRKQGHETRCTKRGSRGVWKPAVDSPCLVGRLRRPCGLGASC